jgi:hypothetical protein
MIWFEVLSVGAHYSILPDLPRFYSIGRKKDRNPPLLDVDFFIAYLDLICCYAT